MVVPQFHGRTTEFAVNQASPRGRARHPKAEGQNHLEEGGETTWRVVQSRGRVYLIDPIVDRSFVRLPNFTTPLGASHLGNG